MPVEEAILAPSGGVTNSRGDGKRDSGLTPAHSEHDWHLFCVINWRAKCRCTYPPSRTSSTACFCIMNPLNTERPTNLFMGHVAVVEPDASPQIWPQLAAQGHLNITMGCVRVTDSGLGVHTAL